MILLIELNSTLPRRVCCLLLACHARLAIFARTARAVCNGAAGWAGPWLCAHSRWWQARQRLPLLDHPPFSTHSHRLPQPRSLGVASRCTEFRAYCFQLIIDLGGIWTVVFKRDQPRHQRKLFLVQLHFLVPILDSRGLRTRLNRGPQVCRHIDSDVHGRCLRRGRLLAWERRGWAPPPGGVAVDLQLHS